MPAIDYTRPGNGMIIVAPNRCSETENADVTFFEYIYITMTKEWNKSFNYFNVINNINVLTHA